MVKRALIIGASILVLGIGLAYGLSLFQEHEFSGTVYQTPTQAPSIVLPASDGTTFELANQQGKIVLIFFGYTSCPDVCPTTLSDLKRVTEILGDKAEQTQVVFVTVDPERDTVEKLHSYLSLFNSTFIGLTGNEKELSQVYTEYGVYREIDTASKTEAGYLVNHSSRLYLINQDGDLYITYSYGTDPESIAADIEYLLDQ
ncbi:MAG: SCO family protein [Anaerolineales bacterium]|jgi:protein SCO1/2